ncbi:hypothetical protein TNIN_98121 [Trichonephila inaurata madagascariensis]|uniref:Uncharacterized protein n=1 Tax=Trichonephila inaurata madagascariensis TaxID=2747483 RepID=A0A8X6XP14_9ARAC|nr:hypothetical protein TNIN_98121 [Trichonephila inaurata madagascariensis]
MQGEEKIFAVGLWKKVNCGLPISGGCGMGRKGDVEDSLLNSRAAACLCLCLKSDSPIKKVTVFVHAHFDALSQSAGPALVPMHLVDGAAVGGVAASRFTRVLTLSPDGSLQNKNNLQETSCTQILFSSEI